MAESQKHIDLVSIAYDYTKTVVSTDKHSLIQCDSPNTPRPTKVVGGFIPDIFFWDKNLLIIGEAKTLKDFDNKHSKSQIQAYYEDCAHFFGESFLIICVPWQLVFSVKNYIRILKQKIHGNVKVVVINDLGWKDLL